MATAKETSCRQGSSGFAVDRADGWLVARFETAQRVASWAVVHGGLGEANAVAWMQVRDAELEAPVDPVELLRERMRARGLVGAVGLITGVDVATCDDVEARCEGAVARCLATVGLGNALRVGDPPGAAPHAGTINALCWVDTPLDDAGLLEALSILAAARTIAVAEAGVRSPRTDRAATGTGTDCLVVACPPAGPRQSYAGMHTAVGSAIGRAAQTAVADGVARWLAEQGGAAPGRRG